MSRTATGSRLSLTETREFLAQVAKHPRLADEIGDCALDEKEAARFIARRAKTLFLVASHTSNTRMQRLAELLFYSAYLSARLKPLDGVAEPAELRDLFESLHEDLQDTAQAEIRL